MCDRERAKVRKGIRMKSGNWGGGHQEEEEFYDDEEFVMKKEGPSNSKEGKNNDKANAIRSKHSVTEQRRRSKINERFQILRELIPHSDQKRDTASFLLEVIEYVRYLQEKVQNYEGSYQGWSQEPTKLMPWRNSHWRVQSFTSHSPAIKNGTGPPSTYSGKIDDSNITITPTILTTAQNPLESNPMMPLEPNIPSSECPITDQQEQTVEGGTISISSVYSETLLNTLTQALQTSGLDLSQASISVQIDLGKRANRNLVSGTSTGKDHDASSGEDSDHQAQKRMKTSS